MAGINTVCDDCPAGQYKATEGINTACDNCPAGQYKATAGVCDNCAGKYSAEGATACVNECIPGTYSLGGAAACTNCVINRGATTAVSKKSRPHHTKYAPFDTYTEFRYLPGDINVVLQPMFDYADAFLQAFLIDITDPDKCVAGSQRECVVYWYSI